MADRRHMLPTLLLAACSASPPGTANVPEPPAQLARFAAACRFLPEDMQSYWFSDYRARQDLVLDGQQFEVCAGRDFQPPMGSAPVHAPSSPSVTTAPNAQQMRV